MKTTWIIVAFIVCTGGAYWLGRSQAPATPSPSDERPPAVADTPQPVELGTDAMHLANVQRDLEEEQLSPHAKTAARGTIPA